MAMAMTILLSAAMTVMTLIPRDIPDMDALMKANRAALSYHQKKRLRELQLQRLVLNPAPTVTAMAMAT